MIITVGPSTRIVLTAKMRNRISDTQSVASNAVILIWNTVDRFVECSIYAMIISIQCQTGDDSNDATYQFYPIRGQPVEHFQEQQRNEQEYESAIEFIPKDR